MSSRLVSRFLVRKIFRPSVRPSLSRASVRSMFALNKYELNRLDSSWKFKKYEKIDRCRVNSYFQYTDTVCMAPKREATQRLHNTLGYRFICGRALPIRALYHHTV